MKQTEVVKKLDKYELKLINWLRSFEDRNDFKSTKPEIYKGIVENHPHLLTLAFKKNNSKEITFKVGDILVYTFALSIRPEFIEVINVSKKTVTVKHLEKSTKATKPWGYLAKPLMNKYIDFFEFNSRKRTSKLRRSVKNDEARGQYVMIGNDRAYKWDGKPIKGEPYMG